MQPYYKNKNKIEINKFKVEINVKISKVIIKQFNYLFYEIKKQGIRFPIQLKSLAK